MIMRRGEKQTAELNLLSSNFKDKVFFLRNGQGFPDRFFLLKFIVRNKRVCTLYTKTIRYELQFDFEIP
jgi:hypothetical protein